LLARGSLHERASCPQKPPASRPLREILHQRAPAKAPMLVIPNPQSLSAARLISGAVNKRDLEAWTEHLLSFVSVTFPFQLHDCPRKHKNSSQAVYGLRSCRNEIIRALPTLI